MFRFSCADFTFPVLERSSALKLVKLLGFEHVDLGLFARSSHFSPKDLLESPQSYTTQVLRDLDAASVGVSDVFVQIGIEPSECAANDPSQTVRTVNRDVFAHALEFCLALGCRHITGLPGVFHSVASRGRDIELALEEASRRVAECEKAGVRYSVEPHIGSVCADVASALAFSASCRWTNADTRLWTLHLRRGNVGQCASAASLRIPCFTSAVAPSESYKRQLRTMPLTSLACSTSCERSATAASSLWNMCGSTGMIATEQTMSQKRLFFGAHWNRRSAKAQR